MFSNIVLEQLKREFLSQPNLKAGTPNTRLHSFPEISEISSAFVDVMMNLKERYPALTGDDIFYCVLSLLCCSKTVMMELMDATSDALKTRKNRIKNKMDAQIFDRVFGVDIQ